MAIVEIKTLTETCWRSCEHFSVDETSYYSNDGVYCKILRCFNKPLCEYAVKCKLEEKEDTDENNNSTGSYNNESDSY